MTNWSKVGKRSRRKGKAFERVVAKMFREKTGYDWQTTRNSGRTDIPGDIYCLDRQMRVVVECKDRPTQMAIKDVVKNNLGYRKEMSKVIEGWRKTKKKYPFLLVVRKDEYGLWVYTKCSGVDRVFPVCFTYTAELADSNKRRWRLLGGFTDGLLRLLDFSSTG